MLHKKAKKPEKQGVFGIFFGFDSRYLLKFEKPPKTGQSLRKPYFTGVFECLNTNGNDDI